MAPCRVDRGVLVVVDLAVAHLVDAVGDAREEGRGLRAEGGPVVGLGECDQLGQGGVLGVAQLVGEDPVREERVHEIELGLEVGGRGARFQERRPCRGELPEVLLDAVQSLRVQLVDGPHVQRAPLGRWERRLLGGETAEPLGLEALVIVLPRRVRGKHDDALVDELQVEIVPRDLVGQIVVERGVGKDHPHAQLVAAGDVHGDAPLVLHARREARVEVRVVLVEEDPVRRGIGPALATERGGVGYGLVREPGLPSR